MSDVTAPTRQRADAVLWPLPADHPSQRKLDEQNREEALAREIGAEKQDDGSWVLPADRRGSSEAKRAERKFGTRSAQRRYERAVQADDEGDWRMVAARAANAEVAARGEEPARAIPAETPAEEARVYFFTAREKESPYHYRKLDAKARELGVELLVDRKKGSEFNGLRYMVGTPPRELEFFRTEEARAAQTASRDRKLGGDTLMRDEANMRAPEGKRAARPLTVSDPDRDYERFQVARDAIRSMGSAKLEAALEVTRQARDEIRDKEDRLVVKGEELAPLDKARFGLYTRGIRLGEKILAERTSSRDSQANLDAAVEKGGEGGRDQPDDRKAPARKASQRRQGHDLEQ